MPSSQGSVPEVGICILNYHHPVETLHCVETLLRREPATTRVLWIENDADATEGAMRQALAGASFPWVVLDAGGRELPPPGTVGVILSPENTGYAGGNNLGLRLLRRAGVPYAWVMNNDTELVEGCSSDLVAAAERRPEVGVWGTLIRATHSRRGKSFGVAYLGGIVSLRDFSITHARSAEELEREPLAYVSGCSLFARTEVFEEVGFIPDDYFLYYEDPAFSYEIKKRGHKIAGLESVVVEHAESLSTGWRSPLLEYYSRRNRWIFIERYHPDALPAQKRRLWYSFQKSLFRLKFARIREEWIAFQDYKRKKTGRTTRKMSREARR